MAHCEFCGAETDNDNLEEINGAIVRVCDDCRNNPEMGGSLYADKLEREQALTPEPAPKLEHKSFDPNASWLAELNQIKQEQDAVALVKEKELLEILREKKRWDEAEKKFNAALLESMESRGIKSIKTDLFNITLTPEHTQKSFDKNALKQAHPDIYAKFEKISTVKSSVRITLKKEKENE